MLVVMQYFICRQVMGLIDYLQWYLVDISSLFNMVDRLFSCEIKGQFEAIGHMFDEPEQCNSFRKFATECPDTSWVSCVVIIVIIVLISSEQ